MAILTTSPLVSTVSGRVDDIIFCRDGVGGPYARGTGIVFNPMTPWQLAVRSMFSDLARAWGALTDARREAWNEFTKKHPFANRLQHSITLTGLDWYVKLNFQRNYYKFPSVPALEITDPPTSLTVRPITQMTISTLDIGTMQPVLSVVPAPQADLDTNLVLFASRAMRAGATSTLPPTFVESLLNATTPVTFDWPTEHLGLPLLGQRVTIGAARLNLDSGAMTETLTRIGTWV